jgi:hypothetical protein
MHMHYALKYDLLLPKAFLSGLQLFVFPIEYLLLFEKPFRKLALK